MADAERAARFEREAKTLAQLNHPHIAQIHGFEESDGCKALVMELVDGPTLVDRIAQGPMPVGEALSIAKQIAEALDAAHEEGIVHRDLKPANVKVRADGTVKILDFGLAKAMQPSGLRRTVSLAPTITTPAMTQAGRILGTAAYMSPEQARGQPVDKRTDIWAFGCVLYELLTGRSAFLGETFTDTLAAVLGREPDWSCLPADAAPLRSLLVRCLDKDPKRRLRDIGDAQFELDAALGARATSVGAPPWSKQAARRRAWLGLASVLTLILVGATTFWLRQNPPVAEPDPLNYTPLTDFADSAVAPSVSPDGRMLAFIRGESTFSGPGEVYVKILPDGEPVQLTRDGRVKMGPKVFSPDGTQIAYSVDIDQTWVIPVLGGEPRLLLAQAGGLTWIGSGPGPRRVLYSKLIARGSLHMGLFTSTESRADERKVYLPADVNGMAHRSALSRDGRWVLTAEMDVGGWLPCRLVPFDGSSQGTPVGPAPAQCTDVAWSPDGQWMYTAANAGDGFHIWRQAFPNGSPEQVTLGPTEEQGVAFDPDGRSFVTSVGDSRSTLWIT